MKTLLLSLFVAASLCGCTQNTRTAMYGGTQTVDLEKGQKFINCTWKISDGSASLWYITRPMRSGETAETFTFQEKSGFGTWQGKVLFVETVATPEKL